jgi:tRNA A37 methylthiotransferase MiaB
MARFHKIEQLEAGISSRINSSYLGQEVEVLVEGQKPKADGDDQWYGRNRQNKLVHFTGDATPGDLVTVRIDHASPWSLVGELLPASVRV